MRLSLTLAPCPDEEIGLWAGVLHGPRPGVTTAWTCHRGSRAHSELRGNPWRGVGEGSAGGLPCRGQGGERPHERHPSARR